MRFVVLGNSGSGKSTLARRLALENGGAVLDLDTVAWEPDKIAVARDPATARADVEEFCRTHASWVVEGCYAGLAEVALSFGPKLIFLDPGPERCIEHCKARPWEPHKYATPEEQDSRLQFLLTWVAEYYTRDGDMSHREHRRTFDEYEGEKELRT